jgi:hypothetical protein
LRSKIDQSKYRVRDVLAIDLPLFFSEEDAIEQAKEKVPKGYHDQTWILNSQVHGRVTSARVNEITDAFFWYQCTILISFAFKQVLRARGTSSVNGWPQVTVRFP